MLSQVSFLDSEFCPYLLAFNVSKLVSVSEPGGQNLDLTSVIHNKSSTFEINPL